MTAGLAFLGGGGGAWLLSIYKARNEAKLAEGKQASDLKRSETDQAFTIYKEIVDSLRHDMEGISKGMHDMEQQHIECKEENAKLNAKLDIQADKLQSQAEEIKFIKIELEKYKGVQK